MKTILVLAHHDSGQESRLQVALDLTRALGGQLSCVDGIAPPAALAFDAYGDVATAELMADESERETANAKRLKDRLAREDVAWNWVESSGFVGDSLEAASGLADLVVVSIGLGANEPAEMRHLASHLTTRLSRPILAVPLDGTRLDTGGIALVAWDGSRPADAALRDAVPLLKLAREVILLVIHKPGAKAADANPAGQYLEQHGIHAVVELAQTKADEALCTAILAKAHAIGAAYIVMGAYGHSPAIETILGGVTRSMLGRSDLPLFLAHR